MIRNISAAKFWKQKMNVNIENYFSIAPESTKESQLKLLHFKKSKSGYIFENIEAWSCHTAFERTPLAPSKIPHSVQARNARFPSLWRHSSAILVFFSLHMSTIALPSFFDRKAAQNSQNKPENLQWTFFWLHCSDCLELAAGRPESFFLPPNFQS